MFENVNMIILKVTKGCNLRCKYCYVRDKDLYTNVFIDFDIYKQLVDQIFFEKRLAHDFREEHESSPSKYPWMNTVFSGIKDEVNLVFHGGEPTMLGADGIRKMCTYALNKSKEYEIPVKFSIQSNGTLMTPELIRVLKDYRFTVGISFDGAYEGSNEQRTMKDISFYSDVMSKLQKVGVDAGSLMVVNKNNIDYFEDNMEYIKNNLNIPFTRANYAEDTENIGGIENTGEEYFQKVSKVIIKNLLEGKTDMAIDENFQAQMKQIIIGMLTGYHEGSSNAQGNCYIKYCGSGGKLIEIDPDGTLSRCGRYAKTDNMSQVGAYNKKDFLSMNAIISNLKAVKEKISACERSHCDLCFARELCDYGCMAFHYARTGKYGIRNELTCPLFKNLKKYIMDNLNPIMKTYILSKIKENNGSYSIFIPDSTKCKQISSRFEKAMLDMNFNISINYTSNNFVNEVILTEFRKNNNKF